MTAKQLLQSIIDRRPIATGRSIHTTAKQGRWLMELCNRNKEWTAPRGGYCIPIEDDTYTLTPVGHTGVVHIYNQPHIEDSRLKS